MANEEASCQIETIFASELSQANYSSFFLNEVFADLQLIVDGREIKAHKIVLAVRSKYFASILMNNPKQPKIILEDFMYEPFLKFLSYIYTGSLVIDNSDVNIFVEILRYAYMSSMEDLKRKVIDKIYPLINTSNISSILNSISLYDIDELKQFCYECIEQNVVEFLNNSLFNNLTQKSIVEFLDRDSLTLPEIIVFEIARKWCSVNNDVDNLVIKCVRLSCLTKAELYSVVKPSKLIDPYSLLEILEKIDNGQVCGLQRVIKNSKNLSETQRTLADLDLPLYQNILSLDSVWIEKAKSVINQNNVFYILNTANLYELVELRNVCHNFMDSHVKEILSNEFFITLTKKSIINLLERNDFSAPGIDIFNAILKWCKANNVYDDSVLSCIRLTLLSIEDLVSIVWPTQLIKTEKLLDTISQIVNNKPGIELSRFKENTNLFFNDSVRFLNLIPVIDVNIATLDFDTRVVSGRNTSKLLSKSSFDNFFKTTNLANCAYHSLNNKNGIVIKLGRIFHFNHIKFQLYDGDKRSYSYYIETSVDSKKWNRILDYSKYCCRSVQELYFDKQIGKFIKIVGTANTAGNYFKLINLEVFYKSEMSEVINEIIRPVENIATPSKHALVIEGENPYIMLNEITTNGLSTYHMINKGHIIVQLAQPYNITDIELLLDNRNKYVGYLIETSVNGKEWSIATDLRYTDTKKIQHLTFSERPVVFFRIKGVYSSTNNWFGCCHFECYSKIKTLK